MLDMVCKHCDTLSTTSSGTRQFVEKVEKVFLLKFSVPKVTSLVYGIGSTKHASLILSNDVLTINSDP